ncbi:PREDICTED: DNA repair protein SWI5 homolog [Rhinopithecus bieti]|uniref:DNA repair protein SWI5 homolog n=1 Tax=Rhinopithecus bieti TaxID=61621 RepID=UPI00083C3BFF|nr:PREDICTED: DNA repair protein SWI5 homolog [Rhinopithecus bieti]
MTFFASQRPSPKSGQTDGTSEESLHLDIQKLKEKRDMLDEEISQFISECCRGANLSTWAMPRSLECSAGTAYNQLTFEGDESSSSVWRMEWRELFHSSAKWAVIRGVTTKELYPEFGLDMND